MVAVRTGDGLTHWWLVQGPVAKASLSPGFV